MSDNDLIYIRDTRTGVSALMRRKMLSHPQWSSHFEEVRSDKPVVPELHTPRRARKEESMIEDPIVAPEAEDE